MKFLDSEEELGRLRRLAHTGGLAVIFGRRRIGKTRLLLWCKQHGGLYTVADQSAAPIQRHYFAASLAARFSGFDQVQYPDWRFLPGRISAEAMHQGWRGPLIVDEFSCLVATSPELPFLEGPLLLPPIILQHISSPIQADTTYIVVLFPLTHKCHFAIVPPCKRGLLFT